MMFEYELTAMPAREADRREAQHREREPPREHRRLGALIEPQRPVGGQHGEQEHRGYGVPPRLQPAANAARHAKFNKSRYCRKHSKAESPAAGPKTDPREEGIAIPPIEEIAAQGCDGERDGKRHQHHMYRMLRERQTGLDIVMVRVPSPLSVFHCNLLTPYAAALLSTLSLVSCSAPLSTVDPAGPLAGAIAEMWWLMLAGAGAIFLGVMIMAFYALRTARAPWRVSDNAMLIGGGLLFPAIVLSGLLIYSLLRWEGVFADAEPSWRVEASSRQWTWSFTHLDAQGGPFTTENELFLPVGEPVEIRVSSADVIHSFWVPQLGGKIDAIPGRTNVVIIQADRPGAYAGQCAEFCGAGHAHMRFIVHAVRTRDELAALTQQGAIAP